MFYNFEHFLQKQIEEQQKRIERFQTRVNKLSVEKPQTEDQSKVYWWNHLEIQLKEKAVQKRTDFIYCHLVFNIRFFSLLDTISEHLSQSSQFDILLIFSYFLMNGFDVGKSLINDFAFSTSFSAT